MLADVELWPRWNPGIASAGLEGPAEAGERGRLSLAMPVVGAVHERTAPPLVVTECEPGRRLVLRQPQPGGAELTIGWDLREQDGGCQLTQTLRGRGVFADGAAPVIQRALGSAFHRQATRLYRLAGGGAGPQARTVVIAGGTGTLGQRLAADLVCRGHRVVVLTRRARPELPFDQVEWDGETVGPWARELADPGRTAVVNLAGRLVDARPTPENIADLARSRVNATRALVEASSELSQPLAYWVQASTTAIWGDAGEQHCDEATPVPVGLPQMTGVAEAWERAFQGANVARGVVLRSALVLDRETPLFQRLSGLTRAGLGGPMGSGNQWMSWIHIEDWLAVVRAALGLVPSVRIPSGVVVAAAPQPVRNRELMAAVRGRLGRRWGVPTPEPLVRLGGMLLRTDPALALTGRHVTSRVLDRLAFPFRYVDVDAALSDLLA